MCSSNEVLLREVEQFFQRCMKYGIATWIEPVKVVSVAEPGVVHFKFKVTEILLNPKGFLHSGVLSLLVDALTYPSAHTLFPFDGASLKLNANFVKGMRHGETVYAKVVAVRGERKTIITEVHFRDSDGNLRAYGGHIIYVVRDRSSPQMNPTIHVDKPFKL